MEQFVYRAFAMHEDGSEWRSEWHYGLDKAKAQAIAWKDSPRVTGTRVDVGIVTVVSRIRPSTDE